MALNGKFNAWCPMRAVDPCSNPNGNWGNAFFVDRNWNDDATSVTESFW